MVTNKIPGLRNERGERAVTPEGDGPNDSICFFTRFLTAALTCERFFHPLLLTGLQVKGVTFHFLDDVLLLYLSLEAAKRIFEGLALLQSDFSQTDYTPQLVPKMDRLVMASIRLLSQVECRDMPLSFRRRTVVRVEPTAAHTRASLSGSL